jgi:hypothetical protein
MARFRELLVLFSPDVQFSLWGVCILAYKLCWPGKSIQSCIYQVKYTELDHQSLTGLHAHSCTQPMIVPPPAICVFLSNLSLLYKSK